MVYYIIDIGPKEFSEQVVVKETADQVGTHMLGRPMNRYKIIKSDSQDWLLENPSLDVNELIKQLEAL